jgi:hypothetical protein
MARTEQGEKCGLGRGKRRKGGKRRLKGVLWTGSRDRPPTWPWTPSWARQCVSCWIILVVYRRDRAMGIRDRTRGRLVGRCGLRPMDLNFSREIERSPARGVGVFKPRPTSQPAVFLSVCKPELQYGVCWLWNFDMQWSSLCNRTSGSGTLGWAGPIAKVWSPSRCAANPLQEPTATSRLFTDNPDLHLLGQEVHTVTGDGQAIFQAHSHRDTAAQPVTPKFTEIRTFPSPDSGED